MNTIYNSTVYHRPPDVSQHRHTHAHFQPILSSTFSVRCRSLVRELWNQSTTPKVSLSLSPFLAGEWPRCCRQETQLRSWPDSIYSRIDACCNHCRLQQLATCTWMFCINSQDFRSCQFSLFDVQSVFIPGISKDWRGYSHPPQKTDSTKWKMLVPLTANPLGADLSWRHNSTLRQKAEEQCSESLSIMRTTPIQSCTGCTQFFHTHTLPHGELFWVYAGVKSVLRLLPALTLLKRVRDVVRDRQTDRQTDRPMLN